ncbi:hypothetical protein DFH09DRAFT_1315648 [Mycena vulgaris]|nr:hypothetical protein DFH09DRAFT_1315648 [Mycena vulgaris]
MNVLLLTSLFLVCIPSLTPTRTLRRSSPAPPHLVISSTRSITPRVIPSLPPRLVILPPFCSPHRIFALLQSSSASPPRARAHSARSCAAPSASLPLLVSLIPIPIPVPIPALLPRPVLLVLPHLRPDDYHSPSGLPLHPLLRHGSRS